MACEQDTVPCESRYGHGRGGMLGRVRAHCVRAAYLLDGRGDAGQVFVVGVLLAALADHDAEQAERIAVAQLFPCRETLQGLALEGARALGLGVAGWKERRGLQQRLSPHFYDCVFGPEGIADRWRSLRERRPPVAAALAETLRSLPDDWLPVMFRGARSVGDVRPALMPYGKAPDPGAAPHLPDWEDCPAATRCRRSAAGTTAGAPRSTSCAAPCTWLLTTTAP
jgi:hypothetical protein